MSSQHHRLPFRVICVIYQQLLVTFSHIANNKLFFSVSLSILLLLVANLIFNVSILHPIEQLHHLQETQRAELRNLEQKQKMIESKLLLANQYLDVHDTDSALEQLENVLSLDAHNVDAMYNVQKVSVLQNIISSPTNYEKAGFMLNLLEGNISGTDVKDPHLLVARGIMVQARKTTESENFFRKALEINKNYPEALVQLALVQKNRGRLTEAIKKLNRAHKLKPYNIRYIQNLASSLKEAKKYEEAIVKYKLLLRIQPDYSLAYLGLSSLYIIQQEFEDAKYIDSMLITIADKKDHFSRQYNSRSWSFPVDEKNVKLSSVEEKQNYLHLRACLSLALAGETDAARNVRTQRNILAASPASTIFHNDLKDVKTLFGTGVRGTVDICV